MRPRRLLRSQLRSRQRPRPSPCYGAAASVRDVARLGRFAYHFCAKNLQRNAVASMTFPRTVERDKAISSGKADSRRTHEDSQVF